MAGVVQRRDRHGLAAVEAGERRIHQFADFHQRRQRVDIGAGAFPDLGARRRGKHGLNIYALGRKFEAEAL
ncbi:hypothetical protein PIB19_16900 [Sphingomonas sp. 7/4-4]|uniref:hypothetical protein n=1 Tax=Sphingomonas sp. 7/4-4 TaxID=3018446 RepID=UPI0022F39F47|nr:hypothetical protein [Sphingomonas sp. 7/4-4]WBY07092.1 hypothetical protein PIB19_16900 [Sphingomonas sp. 7/4-4]